jgi:hypothetical protein
VCLIIVGRGVPRGVFITAISRTTTLPSDVPTVAGLDRGTKYSRIFPRLLTLFFVGLAVVLIARTYKVFDQTWDEPATLAAGINWYAHHSYTLDPIDPPLPRIVTSAGPYLLLHAQPTETKDPWAQGNEILANGNYEQILTYARAGTLLFFVLTAWLLWNRSRRLLGEWPAAVAVLLFCTCEPVLAHAGLATTDVCFIFAFFFASDRLWQHLRKPSVRNALFAGAATAIALVSKLTALPYLVLTCIFFFAAHWLYRRYTATPLFDPSTRQGRRPDWIYLVTCGFCVWAVYFFSIGSFCPVGTAGRDKTIKTLTKFHVPVTPAMFVFDHIPADSYFNGFRDALMMNQHPPKSYFLGKINSRGKFYYFPVLLLVKTPIPFIFLALVGIFLAIRRVIQDNDQNLLPILIGLSVPLLFGVLSHVNVGIRHILAIYPFLAFCGALSVLYFWRMGVWARCSVILLLAWQAGACIHAAPDFLPYFNELAASHADFFVVESDVDWGQDLKRVAPVLQKLGADHIWIAYNGSEDLNRAQLPPWEPLLVDQRPHGWIVISKWKLKMRAPAYGWLQQYSPVATAGHSILIYHLP